MIGEEVLVGLPGQWADDYREKADHYTTKIGGLPDWPIPDVQIGPEFLQCNLCRQKLCLIAQVYSPVSFPSTNFEERVIYIFACTMPDCSSNSRSWRALRLQKCLDETQITDTNLQGTPRKGLVRSCMEGSSLEKEHGESNDESDSDEDLEELARALYEASSLASQSKKGKGSQQSHVSTKHLMFNQEGLDASIPIVPCFYIYCEKEKLTGDASTLSAGCSSLSLKESESTISDPESEEKWEGENYEYDRALGADRTYLKFKKKLDLHPQQCFRYSYGGRPLVAASDLPEPEHCKICGSPRSYEMQLMPPLLYFLHQAADCQSSSPPDGWSWMTLIVCTCSKTCCPSSCHEKPDGCRWAVAEEAVIIQDE